MLPHYTKTFHHTPYPAISPTLPALSTSEKVVVITGGGSGLGPHIASSFAQSGSTSIALIGRTATSLISTAESLSSTFTTLKILTFIADISSSSEIASVFSSIKEKLGPIDILVSNAAYLPDMSTLAECEENELMKGFATNVKGNLNLAQALLKNGVESPTLLHVSASAIHVPFFQKGMGAYVSSKLAAVKLLEYFAFENPNVRVMFVHPGILPTAMIEKATKDLPEIAFTLELDDLELPASFIVWATSPEADFLRGKFIWASWDIDELKAKREELLASPHLTLGLLGWP